MSLPRSSDVLMQTHASENHFAHGRFPRLRDDEITVMFSGGVDSTALAIMLAERYERVHLVTYRNGYGHYYHHRTMARVKELNEKLGGKFTYTLVSIKRYFDEILVNRVLGDYQKYKSGFIWFMGCKMAMHMRSAIYCLENGVSRMTDGSSEDTNEMVEQMLISLTMIRFFYESLDVDFGTPVYEVTRGESRELIRKWNLNLGYQVMDRHLCIQPTCIAGELYYMPYLLFNKRVKHDEEVVAEFIEEKTQICNRIIEEYFAQKGVDFHALLADRKAQRAALAAPDKGALEPTATSAA